MELEFGISEKTPQDLICNCGNVESSYGLNSRYFTKDGEPHAIICGEMHYSRVNKRDYRTELLKMKAQGLNAVSTYVFWLFHEARNGQFTFDGEHDIKAFLSAAKSADMPVVLRIGPWCHAELKHGGLPNHINGLIGKRTNDAQYLNYVTRYFSALYKQVEYYLDGKTVIGIQLENEYGGSAKHLERLRAIAESVGFKTPFFTMTAWPTYVGNSNFLPTYGGYPEAPWSRSRDKLTNNDNFKIIEGRTERALSGDNAKSTAQQEKDLSRYPYASSELGTGNQVTSHRRPIISDKDAFAVPFARFASGMNWLGYYMYHGGRNPRGGLYQESRLTGYPNNLPIIDYDFQAPISRFGYKRKSADRLRLFHYFLTYFDTDAVTKDAYFPSSLPGPFTASIRSDASGSGYLFISNYTRLNDSEAVSDIKANIVASDSAVIIPGLGVEAGAMYFLPFGLKADGLKFDYITAEPIAKIKRGNDTLMYFKVCEGLEPKLALGGKVVELTPDTDGYALNGEKGKVRIIVMSEERSMDFYIFGEHIVFTNADVYTDGGELVFLTDGEKYANIDGKDIDLGIPDNNIAVKLEEIEKVKLPYNHFLYSHAKRKYYKLDIQGALDNHDVMIEFRFDGLNLQLFGGKLLIDDLFNYDGVYKLSLRDIEEYMDSELIIRTAGASFGVGNAYREYVPSGDEGLTIKSVKAISMKSVRLN